jgi:RNA polymerase-interacting CarD/CdnL/TRCF family regulator
MNFKTGDWVVHCAHGLGQITTIENRSFGEESIPYYMIQIADLTIWVPLDENLDKRLRPPITQAGFQSLINTLTGVPEDLPTDRRQRSQHLLDILKEGTAESVCRVIRDLTAHRKNRSWSESDGELMRRIKKIFIGEWSFTFSIPPLAAEAELQKLLSQTI